MAIYVQTIIREAHPKTQNGEEGYAVAYPNGYKSWIPKAVFEQYNRPLTGDEDSMVEASLSLREE